MFQCQKNTKRNTTYFQKNKCTNETNTLLQFLVFRSFSETSVCARVPVYALFMNLSTYRAHRILHLLYVIHTNCPMQEAFGG